jgi:serine/threonine protein phosphatase PrpC
MSLQEARARALTLNMTRALGHVMLSQHGVSHRPDVGHCRVDGEEVKGEKGEGWVVMGSDGLWDVLTADEVLLLVEKELREQRSRRGRGGAVCANVSGGVCLQCLCCQLAERAEAKWKARSGGDNITVVIARIHQANTAQGSA